MKRILSKNRALLTLDVEMDCLFTFLTKKGYDLYLLIKFHCQAYSANEIQSPEMI